MNKLIQNIRYTLIELDNALSTLTEAQFSQSLPIYSGSTIGMHARHVVEFYQCLLCQLNENQSINYDKRSRDLLLQTNLDYFSEAVESVISTLEKLDETQLKSPLSILTNDMQNAMTSSLDRELHYNLEHTIHHAALIKIGILTLTPSRKLPDSFGVAPSTIRYREQKNT
ncbi:MAG: DinB family protein [Saprospiraceae bacterium]|nr:DinB family protein [Saprospiraceae bacterium]